MIDVRSPAPERLGWTSTSPERGTADILYSCFATLFVCSWAVVHLNVPAAQESWWKTFQRKAKWMCITLLAPELVTGIAFEECQQTRRLTALMQDRVDDWQPIHSFYAMMGGFRQLEGGHHSIQKHVKTLDPRDNPESFRDVLLRHEFLLPSAEEIEDKSKADAFVKGFAVLQSSWLVGQCIARACYGLPVSELELSTCAFVACTIITYRFWWHKPLDVASATLLRVPASEPSHETRSDGAAAIADPQAQQVYQPPKAIRYEEPRRVSNFRSFFHHGFVVDVAGGISNSSPDEDDYYYVYGCRGLDKTITYALLVGLVFGAIHLAAWDFSFPSRSERIAWRVSSLIITLLAPASFLSLGAWHCYQCMACLSHCCQYDFDVNERPWTMLTGLLVAFYLIARFVLIALIFSCFRSMPAEVYVTIKWLQYVPHF